MTIFMICIKFMKIIITERQSEFLESQREFIGAGSFHNVYTVYKDETKVVKIGTPDDVQFYAEQFKKFPDLFPEVYKYGLFKSNFENFKGKNLDNNTLGYMYIEKLNTKDFETKFDLMYNFIFSTYELRRDWQNALNYLIWFGDMSKVNHLKKHFYEEANEELKDFFDEYFSICQKILENCEKGEICFHSSLGGADIHGGNFGIDNNGKIKCLDF